MALNSKKFLKLRKKINKKLIGNYGEEKGLGQDLVIKRFSYTLNNYGDRTQVLEEEILVKAIVIVSTDAQYSSIPDMNLKTGLVTLYIPTSDKYNEQFNFFFDINLQQGTDYNVEDSQSKHYEFEFMNNEWVLVSTDLIGKVANVPGVVREIVIRKKHKA